jgi:hypothetical protein
LITLFDIDKIKIYNIHQCTMQLIKRVKFEDAVTIRHYEYSKDEEIEDKLGKDWLRTQDLTYREFALPIERGGCGKNWNILQKKLDELVEPCWMMIGMLRHKLYPTAKKLNDRLIEEENYEEGIYEDKINNEQIEETTTNKKDDDDEYSDDEYSDDENNMNCINYDILNANNDIVFYFSDI